MRRDSDVSAIFTTNDIQYTSDHYLRQVLKLKWYKFTGEEPIFINQTFSSTSSNHL